jgi:hypothetical protein
VTALGKFPVRILAGLLAVMIDGIRGFSQALKVNATTVFNRDHLPISSFAVEKASLNNGRISYVRNKKRNWKDNTSLLECSVLSVWLSGLALAVFPCDKLRTAIVFIQFYYL